VRHDCLHYLEQKISLVFDGKKVTSRITINVAHGIHHPLLKKYLLEKESWKKCTWNEIAWPSFNIAFNKIPSTRQPTLTKMLYSCWCFNIRYFRDRAQVKLCCFCESGEEYWKHILSCPGIGATIKINESRNSLKAAQAHFDVPADIWDAIEHRIQYFNK
jgi:hypothetical protein